MMLLILQWEGCKFPSPKSICINWSDVSSQPENHDPHRRLIGIRLSKNVSWGRMERNMPPVYFRSVTAERRR